MTGRGRAGDTETLPFSAAPFTAIAPARSIPWWGLTGILLLLVVLGVLLREKFVHQDQRLLRFDHLIAKSLVLGQNPEQDDQPASTFEQKSARSNPSAPAWAAMPNDRDRSQTAAKPAQSHGNIELAAHFTDEPRREDTDEQAQQFPPTAPRTRQAAAMQGHDMSVAETPRSLFSGPGEEDSRTEHHRSAVPAQRHPSSSSPSELEPFAQAHPISHDPFAANATRTEQTRSRAPAAEEVSLPNSFQPPVAHRASLPEQQPEARDEEKPQRFHHSAGERGASPPPMNIQQVAGTEAASQGGLPEPEPFELTPTPARLPAQQAMPRIPAQPAEIPSLPAELPTLDRPAAGHQHEARPLMPVGRAATAPAQQEPSQFFPGDPAPTRTDLKSNDFEPSLQAVASQSPARPSLDTAAVKKEEVHQVQPGDNYWTISRRYYGSARFFSALSEYNKHRIPQPEKMKPGMYVLIPDAEVLHQRYPQLTGGGGEAEPAPPGYFVDQSGQPCYRVGKGDTLTEIAEQYLGRSSRWVQVYGMNKDRIPDVNSLKIGAVLRLPADATQVVLAPGGSELR